MDDLEIDVLVIGAGPAGLSTAHATADAGFETLVLERQASIGERVRTSGATAIETALRLDAPRSLFHPVQRIRIASPGADATLEIEEICILDVRGFYRWLGARAAAAGAHVLTRHVAKEPLFENGAVAGARVSSEEGAFNIRARVVVDAGGHRGGFSKAAGLHAGFTRFGIGAEYELLAPLARQDEAVLIVGERWAPAGYAWSFPWGDGRVRLGVGVHHVDVRDDPREKLKLLRSESARFALGLDDATVVENHYGLIPAQGLSDRLVADGIVAVGDAGGQASLVVGEGIRISIAAGEMAGAAIAQAMRANRSDRDSLMSYELRFRDAFARESRFGERLNRMLAAPAPDTVWDARVKTLETMPAALVVGLLQSRIEPGAIARWYLARPWRLFRSPSLARAIVNR